MRFTRVYAGDMNGRSPFLLAGVLIGALFTLQLKSDVSPTTSYAWDEYTLQQELLASYVSEQEALESTLESLRGQVEEAESTVSDLYSSIDSDYVQHLKTELGLSSASGSGVEIVLEDSSAVTRDSMLVETNSLIHASDLRDVVNLLRTFPAVGIAINNQRILPISPIKSAGNTILVNNFTIAPPFTITILTDVPDLVIQSLSHEIELPSLYQRVAENGIQFKFKKSEELLVPSYLGGYPTQFITPAKDEEA